MKQRKKIILLLHPKENLYILSDEIFPATKENHFKKGDWIIHAGKPYNVTTEVCHLSGHKIIATTDTELTSKAKVILEGGDYHWSIIHQIPQHIIEAYVKKPFDEVEVEYDEEEVGWDDGQILYEATTPKLNSDGTLAVSLVEEKKVWAKNVSTIHHGKQWTPYTKYGAIVFGEVAGEMKTFKTKEECEEWIKENL